MTPLSPRDVMLRYLDAIHETIIWKLDGLSEHQLRFPLTPTGTNLLGIVKHLGAVELGYFGDSFSLPTNFDASFMFGPDAPPNADMYATADETSAEIIDRFTRAGQFAHDAVADLGLEAVGTVAWWPPERRQVTMLQVCVHMIAELNRHAGHIDLLREQHDGRVGLNEANPNLAGAQEIDWDAYVADLRAIAEGFKSQ